MRSRFIPFLTVSFLFSYVWFLLEVAKPICKYDIIERKLWSNSSIGILVLGLLVAGLFERKTQLEKEFYKIGMLTVAVVYGTIVANCLMIISDPAISLAVFLFFEMTMIVVICYSAGQQGLFKLKK